jgi:UDP-4-amino-4,6-dideoxy-N-acetyl-beta-L-altrosamine transaminase
MSATPTSREVLAIHGGSPVRETLLPYGHQSIEESDIQAVVDVLHSDWLTTGPKVDEFEEAFAAYVGAKHAVSFSSGTAALHAAAFAAGLATGDEAITSPITFAATANCVLYQGARPVFADVTRDTLNIDPEHIAVRITSQTRAVLPVDYSGHPADLDAILNLAEQHGLTVIEDACHALGAEYRRRRVGGISHMSVFSFHPVKHLTTGEGGMVTTDRAEFAQTLRRFRNHGISTDARQRQTAGQWYYEMTLLGFNYRLTDVACALGISQMERLAANLARRRRIAARYTAAFRNMPGVIAPTVRSEVLPAWHLYPIRLDLARLTADRAQFFRALRAENIGVNVHYIPVHTQPFYRRMGFSFGDFPRAEAYYAQAISLPMFATLADAQQDEVVAALRRALA